MSIYKLMSYAVVVAVFGSSVINADAKFFGKGKSAEKQLENDQGKEKKGFFSRIKEKRQRKSDFKETDASESIIKSFKEQSKLLVLDNEGKKSHETLKSLYKKLENTKKMRPDILAEAEKNGFSVGEQPKIHMSILSVIQKLAQNKELTKEDKNIIKSYNNDLKKIQKSNDPKHLANYEINFIDKYLGTDMRHDWYTDAKSEMAAPDYSSEFVSERATQSEDLNRSDVGSLSDVSSSDLPPLPPKSARSQKNNNVNNVNDNVPPAPPLNLGENRTKGGQSNIPTPPPPPAPALKIENSKPATVTHSSNAGLLESIRSHGGVKNLKKTESSASGSRSSVSSKAGSSDTSSLLEEIRRGKKLKKVSEEDLKKKPSISSSNDTTSQLSAVMDKRRQDIAPEEYEEDDDDAWDD